MIVEKMQSKCSKIKCKIVGWQKNCRRYTKKCRETAGMQKKWKGKRRNFEGVMRKKASKLQEISAKVYFVTRKSQNALFQYSFSCISTAETPAPTCKWTFKMQMQLLIFILKVNSQEIRNGNEFGKSEMEVPRQIGKGVITQKPQQRNFSEGQRVYRHILPPKPQFFELIL